ncbi:membrane-associated tyrosine- and threonine-specific cdc2-inhibitory kinase-like [Palaemon carinicauda]|uniref:membrane-associated tyrosine- and threonine-specific cdc2-inhibitory kinase-like n=1 Tax=Palaemon carinicauda TaxID=392227 RepID=UPI0035B5DDB1
MMLIGSPNNSLSYQRPAPVFSSDQRPLSTKKSRGSPKFAPPPRAPVKSCPVTRIFSRIDTDRDRPQPVSFREDSDTSFIAHSPVYSAEKPALYFEQCYTIEEKLGIGSFGEVFKVRSKEDGKFYACKRTLLRFRGEGDRRRRMEEVQKHEKLPKHKNCVEFYRAWEERQHLYLLTEVCCMSLADVANDRHDIPESLIWDYLVDLLQGVHHLHKHQLVHMDIKPENIFFGYDGLCKLGDFGLVIDMSQREREELEGDPKYLAPEILDVKFGPPADTFSLGMTILELATDLDLPKHGDAWQKLRQGELPPAASCLSKDLQFVLKGLLNPNPEERLTAEEALALPCIKHVLFFKKFRDCCRKSVMKARLVMMQTWLYISIMLVFFSRPFVRFRQNTNLGSSPDNSKITESDFAGGYSDDEGLDDHSLAHPLSDISSSSSEAIHYHGQPFGNSTPIGHHFKLRNEVIRTSPIIRNSFNSSPRAADTPSFLRRRGLHQSEKHCDLKNESGSIASSFNDSLSPKREIPVDEDLLPPMNLTSRNLIDLFNAAESDED